MNYNLFSQILSNEFSYAHEFQIVLAKPNKLDQLHLVIDQMAIANQSDVTTEKMRTTLLVKYRDLFELVTDEKSLEFVVKTADKMNFLRSSGSGKLFRIVNSRGK